MEEEKKGKDFEKILGASILGGIASGIIYYIFSQLSEEKKEKVKESILATIKSQIAKWVE